MGYKIECIRCKEGMMGGDESIETSRRHQANWDERAGDKCVSHENSSLREVALRNRCEEQASEALGQVSCKYRRCQMADIRGYEMPNAGYENVE